MDKQVPSGQTLAVPVKPKREPPATLNVKEYVSVITTEHTLDLRSKITTFLFRAYGFLIVATVGIFLLQGFHVYGFNLSEGLLKLLGGTTISEVAGLITLTIKATFKKCSPTLTLFYIFDRFQPMIFQPTETPQTSGSRGGNKTGCNLNGISNIGIFGPRL